MTLKQLDTWRTSRNSNQNHGSRGFNHEILEETMEEIDSLVRDKNEKALTAKSPQ